MLNAKFEQSVVPDVSKDGCSDSPGIDKSTSVQHRRMRPLDLIALDDERSTGDVGVGWKVIQAKCWSWARYR